MPGLLVATARYDRHIPPQTTTADPQRYTFELELRTNQIISTATTKKRTKVGKKHQSTY